LQVCRVSDGASPPLQIVCGANNARAGLRVALARVGAKLPGGLAIKNAKLRGVESAGMLCSAKELGLAESSEGILELPVDAPLGRSLRDYLQLDDEVLELGITPNRGDAMSVLGVAREVAALAGQALGGPKIEPVKAALSEAVPVHLDWPEACSAFAGRVIRGVDNRRPTPLWMRERLRRAGVRSISPIVDVTNYVLLELGQPMHAYDLAKLRGAVHARAARAAEPLRLLDGTELVLDPTALVIADEQGAAGLAGVMGGARSAVSETTTDVFFEAAFFAPAGIARHARRYGLQTDASQRFERGVDPLGGPRAVERATALLLETAGGQAGPVRVATSPNHPPQRPAVDLRRTRLARLLGMQVDDARVTTIFEALGMRVTRNAAGWSVTPPSYRFDITIEADLIEEVARIAGFETVPETDAAVSQHVRAAPEALAAESAVLSAVVARGYQEIISFAFVDPALQTRLFPSAAAATLSNPISSDLAAMRVSLWPGLLKAAIENQHRQQERVRLFEHAVRFEDDAGATREVDTLSGLALGTRFPEQWGTLRESVDFFDVKADVEALFAATGELDSVSFRTAALACLHPGRSARIVRRNQAAGWIGELHPQLVREFGFTYPPTLFEIDYMTLASVRIPVYEAVSPYPTVRRDLAVVVDEGVPLSALQDRVTLAASSLLRDLRVFDVYRGSGVEKGRKSIALGLIFQEKSRTLTDEDTDRVVAAIVAELTASFNARLRE
ncbi:MAG: phenylalanine--tRNA ligase subunit beta, partial [Steroidobacteraceae bacterium]